MGVIYLKKIPSEITRFTNGTLEKKFATRKSRNKNFMKFNPAQYAIDSEEFLWTCSSIFES
jgi:hypothetical protein